ncbi:hypothetical protein QUA03_19375 [Microcoleus sp. S36b_A4]|uniref:hypothetical protein n=1 Tax=Microcoleus sp. S36b_A4 TaxID=3055420 RepID=UPI002FD5FB9E
MGGGGGGFGREDAAFDGEVGKKLGFWRSPSASTSCRNSLGHNLRILNAVKAPVERECYLRYTIKQGWSRNVLVHAI